MEPQTILELRLLKNVSSSYTNFWWGDMLRRSINSNKSFDLKVLTEADMEVDIQRTNNGRYIPYPTFKNMDIPADGMYHLNIQGSNYRFVGWIEIEGQQAAWWGQTGNDDVAVGVAGQGQPCLGNFHNEIGNWITEFSYRDKWEKQTTLAQILKKF